MANRVDEALQSALKTNVSPVVDSIMTFFQKVSHNAISQERPNKRPRTASDEPLLTIFEMTPSQRYPETMLPLAMLHGPPSYLDRQETIKFIVTKMRHDKGKERPAVCWLRSAANSSSRHCGIFLQEILRQCIGQEPNPKQFHRLWQRTSRQTNASLSQPLVTWAQYTEAFDSILIFIDTVECIPGSLLQDFLRILTQLRSEHRLPLQVVLLSPPGRGRRLGLDSSAQGTEGILIRDFFLPSSQVLHDFVWKQVFIERPLPIPLAPSVLRSLRESFDHHHASAVRSMQMLKQALAHSCTQRGAFLLGKDDSLFKKQENQRIRFFQAYHHSDETVKFAADLATTHSVLSLIIRLLHRVVEHFGDGLTSGVSWAEQEFSATCFDAICKRICDRFASQTKLERMAWLAGMRNELQSHETDPEKMTILRDLQSQLDEIIVLAEEVDRLNDNVLTKDLSQMVSEWVYKISAVGATIQARQEDDANRFSPNATAKSTVEAIVPQVRGHLTDAILHLAPLVDISDLNTVAPCLIFLLMQMQDRVVISREECFEAFVKRFKGSSSLEELCSAFAFGMHQLCHCGLVTEKLGSKSNNILYERTALVWCSGS
jgi:hypothetical protein